MAETALIFDFDGVIVLSEPVHCRAWEDVARSFGQRLPEGFLEGGIGKSDGALSDDLAALWEGAAPQDILAAKRRFYQGRAESETNLVSGIAEALDYFARHFPIGLATSSCRNDIEPVLRRYDLARHFGAILTIESVERPKPHPEIYLKAADRLGRSPGRCWVFEDSVQGARAARAAGTRVVGITTTLAPEELHPIEAHFPDFLSHFSIHDLIRDNEREM